MSGQSVRPCRGAGCRRSAMVDFAYCRDCLTALIRGAFGPLTCGQGDCPPYDDERPR